jgi:hypothetical protein
LNRRKGKLWKIRRPSAHTIDQRPFRTKETVGPTKFRVLNPTVLLHVDHGLYLYPSIPVLFIGNRDVEGTGGEAANHVHVCSTPVEKTDKL